MKVVRVSSWLILGILFAVSSQAEEKSVHADHPTPVLVKKVPAPVPPLKSERAEVEVPPEQQSKMGLKTSIVKKEKVQHTIRTVGTITADETKEAHVHTKINGWIERVNADFVGKPVKKGQALYDLYSPDLLSTQEEYLSARKQGGAGKEIAKASLQRLSLWGVPEKEIERLKAGGPAKRSVTFNSPVNGVVIRKTAIHGMYITPEMELYHIADLAQVWIIVTLYEYDIAAIREGDEAEVEVPFDPKLNLTAKISYVSPEIEIETRTAKARIKVDNKNEGYKPGMYVNVVLKKDLGEATVVPDAAVLDTGIRKIVFVKSGESLFEPREVKLGPKVGSQFAILSGLTAGEEVVTSAHFFLDAESKLRASALKGSPAPAKSHGGH